MTLDKVMLRGIFEHERLKPAIVRTNQGNIHILTEWTGYYSIGFNISTTQIAR